MWSVQFLGVYWLCCALPISYYQVERGKCMGMGSGPVALEQWPLKYCNSVKI
jgi:hypothetical protein